MKIFLSILFILFFVEAFPNIEFYNYNKEPISRSYNEFSTLVYSEVSQTLKSKAYFNFSHRKINTLLLRTIDTIIVNHNIKTENYYKKTYFNSTDINYYYNILGSINIDSKNTHLVILCQPKEIKNFKGKLLQIYLLNFNKEFQLISTAKIGEYYKPQESGMYYDEERPYSYKTSTVTKFKSNQISIFTESDLPNCIHSSFWHIFFKRGFFKRSSKKYTPQFDCFIKRNGEIITLDDN